MGVPQFRLDDRLRKICVMALHACIGGLESIREEPIALVDQKGRRLKRRAARFLLKGDHLETELRTHLVIMTRQSKSFQ